MNHQIWPILKKKGYSKVLFLSSSTFTKTAPLNLVINRDLFKIGQSGVNSFYGFQHLHKGKGNGLLKKHSSKQ